jgi:precorrin-6B methylase 2
MFQVLRMKRSDIFLDVGHGIGNSCLQAAYCMGCEARGIEVVKKRFTISLDFEQGLRDVAKIVDNKQARVSDQYHA